MFVYNPSAPNGISKSTTEKSKYEAGLRLPELVSIARQRFDNRPNQYRER